MATNNTNTLNVESLELVAALAEQQGAEIAELAAQVVGEGKDKKRLYRGKIRVEIARRDDWTCFYCGRRVTGRYHIDHVVPHTLGGRTNEANGVFSCPHCNLSKGKKVW
jgi:5-methylcytosine-specific restriction endonuclease McrA